MKTKFTLPILSAVIASVLGSANAGDLPQMPINETSLAMECLSAPGVAVAGNLFLKPTSIGDSNPHFGHQSHSSHQSHQSHQSHMSGM